MLLFFFHEKAGNLNKKQMKKVQKTDELLKSKFGIPPKNKVLPDPLDMLIGTVLSQNTNDRNSYKAYKNLRKKFPTWEEANKAKRTSIEKEIRVAGLGLQKSIAIKEILTGIYKKYGTFSLRILEGNNNDQILEELTAFNGVGVKTASCVLLFSMGRNVCPVDTHVHRTVNRIGIVKASTPDKTFFLLNDDFPPEIAHSFHTNLIRLGREVCKPKNPGCGACPLLKMCRFDQKDTSNTKSADSNSFMLLDHI